MIYLITGTPGTGKTAFAVSSIINNREAQQILLKYMEQMLNDNNRNHTELMNALWAGGGLNPGNTQSMVTGTPGDNTFLTEPYTPVGSNQAQQTQFTVNKDGTVTQTIVQRPDLAANTSQAPTREAVGQQQQVQDTRPAKTDSSAEKPDVCAQNPNSLMCADVGSADYTDPVLPTEQRSLDFSPADIFGTTGVCPQPKTIGVFRTTVKIDYKPMCDVAQGVRFIVILSGMVCALYMVYGAVNNG